MPNNLTQAPSYQAEQAKKALMAFYQKPIAQVSTELFFTIGAIVFLALFAIRPTIVTMTELVKEIEDKSTLSKDLSKKVTSLASVSTEYFSLQDRLTVVEEIVPEQPDTERTLKTIEKIASDNTLSITSLQIQAIPQLPTESIEFSKKNPISVAIAMSIEGEFGDIRSFIEDIAQTRPLLTVESINFSQTTDQNENLRLTSNISLSLHYYGQSSKATNDGDEEDQEYGEDIPVSLDASL